MNFLTNLNLSQNQIQNALMHPLGTPPTGVESQVYYNLTDHLLYVHNGSGWVAVGAPYTLPTASGSVLGGIKVGTGLSIDGSGILSTAAQVNVLESVKVNGSALTITSKAVDILIATGSTNGTIKVNNVDISVYGLDTGAYSAAYVHPNHTGDVTSTGDGATVIGANKVTLGMMAKIATASILGRNTASTGNVEVLSATTVRSILNVADGANNYAHPNHTGDVTSTGDGATVIANKAVTLTKMADITTESILGRKTASTGVPEVLSKSDVLTILNVADGANNYVHPNHTGDVTSTGDGATVIGANKVTNTMLAQMATMTIKGNNTAGAANALDLTATQVRALLNVADGANNYVHPSGDGNLHVPATSTTNNGKVLTAGATAGSLSWVTPTVYEAVITVGTANQIYGTNNAGNAKEWKSFVTPGTTGTAPNWTLATANQITLNIPMASTASVTAGLLSNTDYSKIHTQNTDTGTSSSTFTLGSSGVKIKNSGGTELQVRNNADNDYANLRVKNLIVEGTTTTINSETVELADNQLLLNSNITTSAGNENGGIAVKRLMTDNITRKDAEIYYDTTDERWKTKQGAVTGTLVSATIANKVVAQIGNGSLTSIPVTHSLNTRDCTVLVRETASPYAMVMTDVEFTNLNTVTLKFAIAPTSNQYTVTIIG